MASTPPTAAQLVSLVASLQAALPAPTKAAAQLPSASDLAFERTLSRQLGRQLDAEADRILTLVSKVLTWADPGSGARAQVDGDLIRDGEYRAITERVEGLLEGADDGIEKHLGLGKSKKGGVGAVGAKQMEAGEATTSRAIKERLAPHLLNAVDLVKPQNKFTQRTQVPKPTPPTEDSPAPTSPLWKPILRAKPHATVPLADSLKVESFAPNDARSVLTGTEPPAYPRYAHPYAAELEALAPPAEYFVVPSEPVAPGPKSFEQVPFEWVGDVAGLKKMVDEIREVGKDGRKKELAVDLEHHDLRSYTGITCLIQLSTRDKDYVIDALEPSVRDELDTLNEFFADPSWIKVFHGAASDVIWLQRDFGLYIVGLFDTYHATHVLGHQQHSLAALLAKYTSFEPDKRYQLADWRIRPVPKEMLHYARADTHFLLQIYDHLRLALHALAGAPQDGGEGGEAPARRTAEGLLGEVFERSVGVSASVYSIQPYDFETGHGPEGGWLAVLGKYHQIKAYATARAVPTMPIKTGWGPGEPGLEVLRRLHMWREGVAIEEDESVRHVLNASGLWALAEKRPTEGAQVMQAIGGAKGGVGEVMRRRKEEVAGLIREIVKGEEMEVEEGGVAVVLERGMPAEEPEVRPVAGLSWGAEEPVASTSAAGAGAGLVARTSSFFGGVARAAAKPAKAGLVAARSAFFESLGGKGKEKEKDKGKQPETRAEAVARVHASLVLGGGLANSLTAQAIPAPAPVPVEEEEPVAVAPEEPLAGDAALTGDHSYVPLSGRIPKPSTSTLTAASKTPAAPAPSDKDVLVVSAMADKPKKRRRPKTEDDAAASAATAAGEEDDLSSPAKKVKEDKAGKGEKKEKKKKGAMERLAPHDYSTSPSILDGEGSGLTKAERKGRKETGRAAKGFELDTSGFRREPRVNNAPKKANVSHSFAK